MFIGFFFYNREKDNRKVSNKKIVLFEIGAALVVFFLYSQKKLKFWLSDFLEQL